MARDTIEAQDKKLIQELLEKNQVTVCEAGTTTEDIEYTFGAKKKKPANAK